MTVMSFVIWQSFLLSFCLFFSISVLCLFKLYPTLSFHSFLFSFLLSPSSRKIPHILAKMSISSFRFTSNYSNPSEKKMMQPLWAWVQQNFKRWLWLAQHGSLDQSCNWWMADSDWLAWIMYLFLRKECSVVGSFTRSREVIPKRKSFKAFKKWQIWIQYGIPNIHSRATSIQEQEIIRVVVRHDKFAMIYRSDTE